MVFVWSWSITAPLFDSLEQGEMFLWKCVWHCRKQVIVLRNRMGGDVVWFQSCPTLKRLSSCLRAHSAVSTGGDGLWGVWSGSTSFPRPRTDTKMTFFRSEGTTIYPPFTWLASTFLPCGSPSGTKAIVDGFLVD